MRRPTTMRRPPLPSRRALRQAVPMALLAVLAAAAGGPAPAAAAAPSVLPANLSVAVVSLRQGRPGRRVEARTRPGETVLLRDETEVPVVQGYEGGRARTASVATGLVATVVAEVGPGGLRIRVEATVRELVRLDRVAVAGRPGEALDAPDVSTRTYRVVLEPEVVGNAWHAAASWPESGFGIDVTARPTAFEPARTGAGNR